MPGSRSIFGLLLVQIFSVGSLCLVCCTTDLVTLATLWSTIQLSERGGDTLFQRMAQVHLPAETSDWKTVFSKTVLAHHGGGRNRGLYRPCRFSPLHHPVAVEYLLPTSTTPCFNSTSSGKQLPVKNIEIRPSDETREPRTAKIKMVVFSDFRVPALPSETAFTMNNALRPFQDKIQLTFKNFPLDNSCNPALKYQLHPYACELARLGFCAHEKGKFWDYHDQVFLGFKGDEFEKGKDAVEAAAILPGCSARKKIRRFAWEMINHFSM